MTTPKREYGPLNHQSRKIGRSVNGIPLRVYEPLDKSQGMLVMGSIHGDEGLTTVLLSECLRSIEPHELQASLILAANPDGVLEGTRCNTRGVDLNRNFPSKNWKSDPVYYRNRPDEPQNIALSPGSHGGSEPETMAIIELIATIKPQLIVSLHGFLNCIDDPHASAISVDIAKRTHMELVPDVGYATPGSFGSWCAEQEIPIITYEFPSLSIEKLKAIHHPVLRDLMTGLYNSLLA